MRIFRIQQGPKRIQVIPGSAMYENLKWLLKNFTIKSSEVSMTILRLEEGIQDPVRLTYPIRFFKGWISDIVTPEELEGETKVEKGWLLTNQDCIDCRKIAAHKGEENGHFRLDYVLPKKGRLVSTKSLAHLAAHLAMVHISADAFEGDRPLKLEERTAYSKFNKREIVIIYNGALRSDYVDSYLGIALDFIDSCAAGKPDREFLNHLIYQQTSHLWRRKWEELPEEPT